MTAQEEVMELMCSCWCDCGCISPDFEVNLESELCPDCEKDNHEVPPTDLLSDLIDGLSKKIELYTRKLREHEVGV